MVHRAAALVALVLSTTLLLAQPTPEEFLGYRLGERFTPHHRILGYFAELDRASDLVSMRTIGESYEHRPLVLAVITSPGNQQRLAEIQRNAQRLAVGDTGASLDMPAIVWLAFGVHGNESSSSEAAMDVASALLRDGFAQMRDDLVVIIDPLSNPDGRERYVNFFSQTAGTSPNVDPQAFEHLEPWPGGRFNHYLVDMNRDWAWMSQKETQARVTTYFEWFPQVYVDFHEMSHQSSYFFPPDAKPINVNLPKNVERWLETFGRANADAFTERHWPFFVGEMFDLFYPGYGDAWPSMHGAIGMTYEMAGGGRAGLAVERSDGAILTLGDRVQRHALAGLTTVRTAAANHEALLRYTRDAARTQIDSGRSTFLIPPDSPNFTSLVSLLEKHRIRVDMLTAPATLRATRIARDVTESHAFPAGTAVVSTKQPFGGLATTLLERTPVLSESFVAEQRARADADEPDEFYDLTAWALPLAMNVETWQTTSAVTDASPFRATAPAAPAAAAAYGYLADGLDGNVHRFAGRLLAEGLTFRVAADPLQFGNATYARGSIVVLKGSNDERSDEKVLAAARATGVSLIGLDSGWNGGVALGSERLRHVKNPRVALVGGPGTSPTSYGMLWYTLDIDTPVPHTRLTTDSLRNVDLDDYGVLILPNGSYNDVSRAVVEKVRRWVNEGGTLVAVKGATSLLRMKDAEISNLKPWDAKEADDAEGPTESRYNDYRVPGAAFRTTMNERSYLTFGVPRAPAVLVEGSRAFQQLPRRVDNVLTIENTDPLITGVAWTESVERLRGSVYVARETVGRGQVITFADDPNFRLFWRGTLPMFLNAVMYGPSFGR